MQFWLAGFFIRLDSRGVLLDTFLGWTLVGLENGLDQTGLVWSFGWIWLGWPGDLVGFGDWIVLKILMDCRFDGVGLEIMLG